MSATNTSLPGFSEKDFYLAEFRGRAIAIALERADERGLESLAWVLEQLATNGTRVVLLSPDSALLERIVPGNSISSEESLWVSVLWRQVRESGCVALRVDVADTGFVAACRKVADRLQLAKLVLIDAHEALRQSDGARLSYLDRAQLQRLLEEPPAALAGDRVTTLREIHAMVSAGLPAVNLCSLEGLAEELFTYAGSGTLITRDRYTVVRRLSLDDFDAANHLIGRGVSEGYLFARSDAELDVALAHAFGVFIEDRYLAGLGALIPHAGVSGGAAGEVASLYTVTRFLGEGVGGHLLRFARDSAEQSGMSFLFACTTSERVEAFFVRNGYQVVAQDALPDSKWEKYPAERRADVRCLRLDLVEREAV